MTIRDDPEGMEIRTLMKHVPLNGKEVLEVGCGEGRLTYKYYARAKRVLAIDPLASSIRRAKHFAPKGAHAPEFRVGRGEKLALRDESFDVAFFSWSLCCIDVPAMGKALDEAWRVLRPGGTLVNMQPSLYQPFSKGAVSYLIDGQFGTTVDDERYRQARMALKYAALIEGKFKPVAEEEFSVSTYYDSVSEALKDLTADSREHYSALDRKTKARIKEIIGSMRTRKGIRTKDNVVLSVLAKSSPGAKLPRQNF
jgi:ubiquinone/menaquinone biosynthesis C-methylase UbiE